MSPPLHPNLKFMGPIENDQEDFSDKEFKCVTTTIAKKRKEKIKE